MKNYKFILIIHVLLFLFLSDLNAQFLKEKDAIDYIEKNKEILDPIEGVYIMNDNYILVTTYSYGDVTTNNNFSSKKIIVKDPNKSSFYYVYNVNEVSGDMNNYSSIKKIYKTQYAKIFSEKEVIYFTYNNDGFEVTTKSANCPFLHKNIYNYKKIYPINELNKGE